MTGYAEHWSLVRLAPAKIAVHASVLTALVGGVAGYSALDKSVTLVVNGEERTVHSFGGTVGDVLADEDVVVGARDAVAPAPSSDLRDGTRISVRHARLLTLDVDGKARAVWTTASTVGEALDEVGVRGDGVYLSASRSRRIGTDGLELDVRTPRKVTIVADGRRTPHTTTAATVRAALAEAEVKVGDRDKVSADLTGFPTSGQVIRIQRIDVRKVVRNRTVPFDTVERRSDDVYEGETDVARDGRAGRLRRTWSLTFTDGRKTAQRLLKQTVTRKPVDRVVLVGTKERPKPAASSSSSASSAAAPTSDGLNWAALARCESGGNPRAVNPAGYYGLYQFSIGTWRGVGGSGRPDQASASEQTARAQMLYKRGGRSPWPHCGRHL
jgi:uncharacterized protein YabE (DUF348 family)